MNRSRSRQPILIALIVSLGGFLFGFDASVISGVIKYIKPEFMLSDIELGWVVSSPSFSAMFAMLIAGGISDRFGRKKVLISIAVLYAVSALLSAIAVDFFMLVVARMIGGIAFGAALVLAPVYIAEISSAKDRGKLVSIQQLNIVIGFSVAYFSNYLILKNTGVGEIFSEAIGWRWMLGIEFLPAVIYFGALFFVPKSPRWLFVKGRNDEARVVLEKLHGKDDAKKEAEQIEESIKTELSNKQGTIRELFTKSLRFVFIVGLTIGVLQQITGVNAIYFYATSIFEQSGIGTDASFAQAIWVGIINVVFTILAMSLIDRIGRKPLLLIGIAGIAVSMMVTAYGFSEAKYSLVEDKISTIEDFDDSKLESILDMEFSSDVEFKEALKSVLGEQEYSKYEGALIEASISMNSILVLIGILGFVASFAFSLGPVMWVMLSELFPNRIRGVAISVIGFINSLTSWLVQFIFPWELSNFGNSITYLIYGLFAIVGFIVLIRILPETKGKSLEEIETELVTNG